MRYRPAAISPSPVALRKESVDRNRVYQLRSGRRVWSLSARRAWIEIAMAAFTAAGVAVALRKESVDRNLALLIGRFTAVAVALRKESVDRNIGPALGILGTVGSLSARRAWIEIDLCGCFWHSRDVALRKESVDRNSTAGCNMDSSNRRSPQGERG